jgi:hypothetical protein
LRNALVAARGEDDPEKEEARIRKEEMKRENDQSNYMIVFLPFFILSLSPAQACRFGCLFESFLILPSMTREDESAGGQMISKMGRQSGRYAG